MRCRVAYLYLLIHLLAGYTAHARSIRLQTHFIEDTLQTRRPFANSDTLSEVTITGVQLLKMQRSLTPVQSLSKEQLERLNSFSVADALRYFSGLQIKDYGGIGGLKTINVRSMGSNHTAVFYDGMQINNAQNGQIDLGRFSLDNLEEIEVYMGQKSAVLQPARAFSAASALYLQSLKPLFKAGQSRNVQASLGLGSTSLVKPSLRMEQKISSSVSMTALAEYTRAKGDYKFRYTNSVYDTTARRQNGDIQSFKTELAWYGNPQNSSQWSVKGFYYDSERGLPRAIISNNFETDERLKDLSAFLQASFQTAAHARWKLLANARYAYDYTRYLDPVYPNLKGKIDNYYKQHEFYASLVNSIEIMPGWQAGLSADFVVNRMDANLYSFAYPTRYTQLVAVSSEWQRGPIKLHASLLGTVAHEKVKNGRAADDKQEWTPSFTAAWTPLGDKSLLIRGFYKRIFRLPTFNDLYYTFVGSATLKPEFADQYDLGFSYQREYVTGFVKLLALNADAYYNKVTDKITAVPGENLFRWRMANIGKADIRGLDAGARAAGRFNTHTSLQAGITYTFQQAHDITDPEDEMSYEHQLAYTPVHSGSLTASVQHKSWAFNYSYLYCGQRYFSKVNTNEYKLEPWYTHDLAVVKTWQLDTLRFKASAQVNNLFNQYRDIVKSFPLEGRSYRLHLILNY